VVAGRKRETAMATNGITKGWESLKAGITGYDFFVNFVSPMILLVVSFVHLFYGFLLACRLAGSASLSLTCISSS